MPVKENADMNALFLALLRFNYTAHATIGKNLWVSLLVKFEHVRIQGCLVMYRFHVFHNYQAVSTNTDFARRKKVDDEREELEYKLFPSTVLLRLHIADSETRCEPVFGSKGLVVSVHTRTPLFDVQMALARALVERNTLVEGLFLDFKTDEPLDF